MKNDTPSIEDEYIRWRAEALSIAKRKLKSRTLAEDAVQTSALRYCQRQHGRDLPHENRRAYFFKILQRVVINIANSESGQRDRIQNARRHGRLRLAHEERRHRITDREAAVEHAMESLAGIDRRILHDIFVESYSVTEVARRLRTTPANISTRKYRSLKTLHTRITELLSR